MSMSDFWERVDNLRSQASMTQHRLSDKLGLSQRTVESWKQRKFIPGGDVCVAIAKLFETTTEYLITGEELPLPDDCFVETAEKETFYSTKGPVKLEDDEEPTILVPIAPQKISAGHGEEFLTSPGEYVGHVRILERMARGLDTTRLIAAVVKGDSMTGVQIFSGDVVVFARGYLDENGLYVVSLRGEVLVKRLEFDRIHEQIAIISENKNYRPITVDAHDDGINILGKVVGWVHCHPY